MTLRDHAWRELRRTGWLDPQDAESGQAILKAVEAFGQGGWSGGSAPFGIGIVNELLQFHPLGPLTDDPGEWQDVAGEMGGRTPVYQNRRDGRCFSSPPFHWYTMVDDPSWLGWLHHQVRHLLASDWVPTWVWRSWWRYTQPPHRTKRVVLRRAHDGGQPGTVIRCYRCDGTKIVDRYGRERGRRCPECGGTGELHRPDVRPEPVEPEQP